MRKNTIKGDISIKEMKEIKPWQFFKFNLLVLFTGIAAGTFAVFFRYLIFGIRDLFQNYGVSMLGGSVNALFLIIPFGGLLVGLLTYYGAREAKGHGVPEVMLASEVHGGKIRPRVVLIKALASAICIGSGGSAGREGPIVQMGATIGSTIAQFLRLSRYETRILLACGAAGGISATFNTPIAGVLFAIELIIREVKTRSFISIVITSVFSALTARSILALLGVHERYIFDIPQYCMKNPYEIIFYLGLGIVAAIIGIFFVKLLYGLEDFFDKLKLPEYIKPAIGGLLLAIVAVVFHHYFGETYILGIGYNAIEKLLNNGMIPIMIFSIVILKILATSLTLGSGGSGGIFAPSLVIGAMTGAAYGIIIHHIFPDITAGYKAYALVGMAAVFTAVSRATLTAIVIVFEMTGNYAIILPLMFACVVSDAISVIWLKETIYTIKIKRRGINIEHDMDINIFKTVTANELMRKEFITVSEDMCIRELHSKMNETDIKSFPVVDNNNSLVGVVKKYYFSGLSLEQKEKIKVKEIIRPLRFYIYPDDNLEEIMLKVGLKEISYFLVVEPENKKKLVGIFTKGDMIRAYNKKAIEEYS